MSRFQAALVVAALVGATACADNILKERPVNRAAQQPPSLSAADAPNTESSVCSAYRRQLRQVQAALKMPVLAGKRDQLRARELTLNAMIADACE